MAPTLETIFKDGFTHIFFLIFILTMFFLCLHSSIQIFPLFWIKLSQHCLHFQIESSHLNLQISLNIKPSLTFASIIINVPQNLLKIIIFKLYSFLI